jgi:hypothetical protein
MTIEINHLIVPASDKHAGTPTYADPSRSQPGQINHRYGGRGVYFDDPDGHFFELLTAAPPE